MNKKLRVGDWVKYKDGDPDVFMVCQIYSENMVSLGLRDYPEVEQDYQVNVSELIKVKNKYIQCGSCDQVSNKPDKDYQCPKCGSGNWVWGNIDEEEEL